MYPKKHEAHMSNDARIAILETTIININSSLLDIKQEIKDIKYEIKDVKNDINKKFDVINNRLWSNFLWLMGMIIGLAGLIAHTQHWI